MIKKNICCFKDISKLSIFFLNKNINYFFTLKNNIDNFYCGFIKPDNMTDEYEQKYYDLEVSKYRTI